MEANLLKILAAVMLNILIVLLLSPLLEGIMRKLVALVHSRIGPPLHQPYLDILKLLGKEEIISSRFILFRFSAHLAFAAVLASAVLVPILGPPALPQAGDVLVFVYLITVASIMVIMSGVTSASPYGLVGAAREMMMIMIVEPVIIIALLTLAVKSGSMQFSDMMAFQAAHGFKISTFIVAGALFLAIVAQMARLPFDMVEADQEIMEGPFIEQSGAKLAYFKWMFYAKGFIFAAVFVSLFLPWPNTPYFLLHAVFTLIKVIVVFAVVGLVHVVNPRLRIDQAVRYFGGVIFVALIGMAFALVGS